MSSVFMAMMFMYSFLFNSMNGASSPPSSAHAHKAMRKEIVKAKLRYGTGIEDFPAISLVVTGCLLLELIWDSCNLC